MSGTKKVFSKLNFSPLKESIGVTAQDAGSAKKIVATKILPSLREEFKRTFLPLLIDVFELRQMIENYKLQKEGDPLPKKLTQTPEEILAQLLQMQETVEESMRWCSGLILQLSKGIEEAKEALEFLKEEEEKPEKGSLWATLKEKIGL